MGRLYVKQSPREKRCPHPYPRLQSFPGLNRQGSFSPPDSKTTGYGGLRLIRLAKGPLQPI